MIIVFIYKFYFYNLNQSFIQPLKSLIMCKTIEALLPPPPPHILEIIITLEM